MTLILRYVLRVQYVWSNMGRLKNFSWWDRYIIVSFARFCTILNHFSILWHLNPCYGLCCGIYLPLLCSVYMMTSLNGNFFRVTGHLRGEFTGIRWIPRTKAIDAEVWCFLWSTPEWWGWWFETLSGPLWRHCNDNTVQCFGSSQMCTW